MPKHPEFTSTTWRDQQRLLADGKRLESGFTTLWLIAGAAFILGWVGLVVYTLWGIWR